MWGKELIELIRELEGILVKMESAQNCNCANFKPKEVRGCKTCKHSYRNNVTKSTCSDLGCGLNYSHWQPVEVPKCQECRWSDLKHIGHGHCIGTMLDPDLKCFQPERRKVVGENTDRRKKS